MTAKASKENFLALEGRHLASGEKSQLTPEEWLYAYGEIKEELAAAKLPVFDKFEEKIRNLIVARDIEHDVAV